jgi:hypothetical protein
MKEKKSKEALALTLVAHAKLRQTSTGEPHMNFEEIERTMAFIVSQQAQFTVDIERLDRADVKLNRSLTRTARLLDLLAHETLENRRNWEASLAAEREERARAKSELDEKMAALIDAQIRNEDAHIKRMAAHDERMTELKEAQAKTESKLQKFLDGLDRDRRKKNGSN